MLVGHGCGGFIGRVFVMFIVGELGRGMISCLFYRFVVNGCTKEELFCVCIVLMLYRTMDKRQDEDEVNKLKS